MLSGVGDALVQLGDFRFRFLPVIRKLLLACQPPLQLLELGQELFEWGQPVYGSAFRRRDELGYPPAVAACRGGSTCSNVLTLTYHWPADWLTVTLRISPRTSRLLR